MTERTSFMSNVDGDEQQTERLNQSRSNVSIKDRVRPVEKYDISEESSQSIQSKEQISRLSSKKIKLSEVYFQSDFLDPDFKLTLESQTISSATLPTGMNKGGYDQGGLGIDSMYIVCPYRDKVAYDAIVAKSQTISPCHVNAALAELIEFKDDAKPEMIKRAERCAFMPPYLPDCIVVLGKRKPSNPEAKMTKKKASLEIIKSVAVDGLSQVQAAKVNHCSQSTVSKIMRHFYSSGDVLSRKTRPGPESNNIDWSSIRQYLNSVRTNNWNIFSSYSSLIIHLISKFPELKSFKKNTIEAYLRRFVGTSSYKVTITSSKMKSDSMHTLLRYYFIELSRMITQKEPLIFFDESCFQEKNLKQTGIRLDKSPVFCPSRPTNYNLNILLCCEYGKVLSIQACSHRFTRLTFWDFFRKTIKQYKFMNKVTKKPLTVVLDNCSAHFSSQLEEYVKNNNIRLLYLPPKVPMYNFAEFVFMNMKRSLRQQWKVLKPGILKTIEDFLKYRSQSLHRCQLSSFLRELDISAIS